MVEYCIFTLQCKAERRKKGVVDNRTYIIQWFSFNLNIFIITKLNNELYPLWTDSQLHPVFFLFLIFFFLFRFLIESTINEEILSFTEIHGSRFWYDFFFVVIFVLNLFSIYLFPYFSFLNCFLFNFELAASPAKWLYDALLLLLFSHNHCFNIASNAIDYERNGWKTIKKLCAVMLHSIAYQKIRLYRLPFIVNAWSMWMCVCVKLCIFYLSFSFIFQLISSFRFYFTFLTWKFYTV